MKAIFSIVLLLWASAGVAAPPFSALLTHDSADTGSDGVTRSTHYQERFIRTDEAIWLERVLPQTSVGMIKTHAQNAGHDELNIYTVPRLVHAAASGDATLELVDHASRALYAVGPEDYGRAGFSGRWLTEYSLLNPASLSGMKRLPEKTLSADTHWYEQRSGSDYTRVLWNDKLEFPLVLETGSMDGRHRSRTVAVLGNDHAAPWLKVRDYAHRELSDLGD